MQILSRILDRIVNHGFTKDGVGETVALSIDYRKVRYFEGEHLLKAKAILRSSLKTYFIGALIVLLICEYYEGYDDLGLLLVFGSTILNYLRIYTIPYTPKKTTFSKLMNDLATANSYFSLSLGMLCNTIFLVLLSQKAHELMYDDSNIDIKKILILIAGFAFLFSMLLLISIQVRIKISKTTLAHL